MPRAVGSGLAPRIRPKTRNCPATRPFQLERVLGVGGFGVVYLAFDPTLHRLVALKVPLVAFPGERGPASAVSTRSRAAAALDHPHIVPIHKTGQIGPVCYIVAAYCNGHNLAEWLKTQTWARPGLPGGPVDRSTRLCDPLQPLVGSAAPRSEAEQRALRAE